MVHGTRDDVASHRHPGPWWHGLSSRRPARRSIQRDARIITIYEGTTGIQANDLIGRKIAREKGITAQAVIAAMKATDRQLAEAPGTDFSAIRAALNDGVRRWMKRPAGLSTLIQATSKLLPRARCRSLNCSASSPAAGRWRVRRSPRKRN